jgi:hypothetical protein
MPDDYTKVQFYDADVGYENLWAVALGNDLFRIESVPFFIYEISRNDVVLARPASDGRLQFLEVVRPSTNRTLRTRLRSYMAEDPDGRSLIGSLKQLGCEVEVLRSRLLAINVPRTADLGAVTQMLSDRSLQWEYANPTPEQMEKANKQR